MNGRLQDEMTVQLHVRPGRPAGSPADDVTVCLPGSALAPPPPALVTQAVKLDEAPVFVDDSGTRKNLLRVAGVIVGVLSVAFLSLVGVALAVPSVATSVGLDNVAPFLVPGAAAKPPPPAPAAQPVKPRVAKPKPRVTTQAKPKPVVVVPTTTKPKPAPKPVVAPPSKAPVSKAPVSKAPVSKAPESKAPEPKAPVTDPPDAGSTPPAVDGAAADGETAPAGQAPADQNPPAQNG